MKKIKILNYSFTFITDIKRYWVYIIGIYICLFVLIITNYFQPIIIQQIMDEGMIQRNKELLVTKVLTLFGIVVIGQAVEFIQSMIIARFHNKFFIDIYYRAFARLLQLKRSFFREKNTSEIIHQLQTDVKNIASLTDSSFFSIIKFFVTMISGVVGLLSINPQLTLIVLFLLPIKYFLGKFVACRQSEIVKHEINVENLFVGWLGDQVNGISEIKLWNLYNLKKKLFTEKQKEVIKCKQQKMFLQSFYTIIDMNLVWLVNCMLYFIGGILVMNSYHTPGEIIAFITFSTYVINPFMALLGLGVIISNIIPSMERYKQFMELQIEESGSNRNILSKISCLKLDNVSFAYGRNMILDKVDLNINYGEKIAILGENGSGKSTLIDMILRFSIPTDGKIMLNGKDIKEYEIDEYRSLFSVVLQNNHIFLDSLKNNIDLSDKYGIECIQEVTSIVGINPSESWDAPVGVNGMNLSGGERQRIAIARALIKNSEVIILDEITSSQDINFDYLLSDIINGKFTNKIVIMITHKKEHLHLMDHIYEINSGQIKQVK